MAPVLAAAHVPQVSAVVGPRVLFVSALAIVVAFVAGIIARVLVNAIALVTNLAFFARLSLHPVAPADNHLGWFVVIVPVIGGVIVGLMARYGSKAIRGHGIPEAMEQVLTNESRIPPRLTFLKPMSAAIAIGTGGPFGAEGPIIATGGALGSLVGQILKTSSAERKTLLAAGAAAGMAATFGSPVSAVLLAVELLLFEFRARSIIPVALASATAAGVRMALVGSAPVFAMPQLQQPSGEALAFYILLGGVIGVVATGVTRAVYAVEDAFEKLPIHWMWWPAIGGLAVGGVGYFAPRTMGVGYDNIEHVLSGSLTGQALLMLFVLKFISWAIALGSGTSGGTLAPLFTIGGGLGATLGAVTALALPHIGIDPRIAGLVGMAAIFAGASRALLASVVFAFETTLQPLGLLPLLGGCTAAYLASCFLMRNTHQESKVMSRFYVYTLGLLVSTPLLVAGCSKKAAPDTTATATPAAPEPPPPPDPAADARALFRSKCLACHGDHGAGDGPGAAALNPKPRAFGDAVWQASVTDDQIKKTIVEGGAAVGKSVAMSSNPELKDKPEELTALVKIVRDFKH